MKSLKYLVFDEADKILEDGFMTEIRAISQMEDFPAVS